MKFGYFDDSRREYVITSPRTPYPWINYLGSEAFFTLISNTAGGYSFYKDARLRRITRYRYNNVPADMGGKYFYIHDGGDFWSPGWSPVKRDLDAYECRHGMGYTNISGTRGGVKADVLYFVPLGADCEVQRVRVTNVSDGEKDVKLFSFVEFCLWNAYDDMTNFQRNFSTGEVEVRENKVKGSAIYHKTEYKERRDHYAFYSVNAPIAGFDTDRESFVGLYDGFDAPRAVAEGKPRNSVADGWSPIASHCLDVTLSPGETKEFIFVLGYVENKKDKKWESKGVINKNKAEDMIARFSTTEAVDKALSDLSDRWDSLLSAFTVTTPDDKLNRMVNIWNQYQCMVTFNLSRSASYFESGIGRGMGFRDSNQDLLGFVHQIPSRARERLIDLAATQLRDGGAYHQYQPLTKKGNNEIGSGFNDDPLWLIAAVSAYVKETGDVSILSEQVPFENDESLSASMFEHLTRSLNHVTDNIGPHGLPLIGRADWNDCLNLNCFSDTPDESFQTTTSKEGKTAESVMIAGMFAAYGLEYAALAELLNEREKADKTRAAVEQMKGVIGKHGRSVDGGEGWYVRAYDDDSKPIGSVSNEEGKIFIESQGWCVMAGAGKDDGFDVKAMEAVDKYLNTKHGAVLLNPAFTKYWIEYGEISTYPAGYKENGAIFCHNNAWIICAEAVLGHGDKAYEYYSKIAPAFREDISDVHRLEPYVYAQMIAGKDAKRFGEAKNSWLTGTAAWNFVAVSQYILGVRAELDGLTVNPAIPKGWGGFTATRKYRGATYNITVENKSGTGYGVKEFYVDGEKTGGHSAPIFGSGTHEVKVII